MPFKAGDRGPALALGDWNNDGKTDIFFGSSKLEQPLLLIQNDSTFTEQKLPVLQKDSVLELVSVQMKDFNADGKKQIYLSALVGQTSTGKVPNYAMHCLHNLIHHWSNQ